MKLYFIRHGRTEWNEEGRFQGSNGDSPLLPASIHQLEKLGKHLATVPFDAAFASDLPRTVHTAQIILDQLETPLKLLPTPALREWNLGGGLDNASVTILTTDDFEHYHLEKWNDTSYIED